MMSQKKIYKSIKNVTKTVDSLFIFVFCLIFNTICVFAGEIGDPWEALSNESYTMSNIDSGVKDITVSLYRILQRIGLYGCIITALIFLGMMVLRWNDPRAHSENKDKVISKFVVTFAICAASGILGVLIQVVKYAADY